MSNQGSKLQKMRQHNKRQTLLLGFLGILLVLLAIGAGDRFFTVYNFQSMAFQLPELGLITLGMLLVVITGGIDLSLTYTAALSGICGALLLKKVVEQGMAIPTAIVLAVVVTLAVSALCGAIKGLFVARFHVHPWLATLGTMSLFQGIGIIITKGGSVSGLPIEFYNAIGNAKVLGIPVVMLILVLVLILVGILLHRTGFGKQVLAVGSNDNVARYSGIPVVAIRFWAYVLSSLIAGVGGVIMVSRYNSAKIDHGYSYLMQSIAIIVLSGADINGGSANVVSLAITMVLIQFLYTGSSMLGGDRYAVVILTGLIFIGILLLNTWLDTRTRRKEIQALRK